ncbi:hypothetical protein BT69DRAFT_1284889 [Atractiella rhizophila]|nr:hypothetical protein BT69DRAFT_1284889 [Atractiella rhizophila]
MDSMTSIQVSPVQIQSKLINRLPYSSKSEQKQPATTAQRWFHRVRQGGGLNLESAGQKLERGRFRKEARLASAARVVPS